MRLAFVDIPNVWPGQAIVALNCHARVFWQCPERGEQWMVGGYCQECFEKFSYKPGIQIPILYPVVIYRKPRDPSNHLRRSPDPDGSKKHNNDGPQSSPPRCVAYHGLSGSKMLETAKRVLVDWADLCKKYEAVGNDPLSYETVYLGNEIEEAEGAQGRAGSVWSRTHAG